jgi:hypothetical protein
MTNKYDSREVIKFHLRIAADFITDTLNKAEMTKDELHNKWIKYFKEKLEGKLDED